MINEDRNNPDSWPSFVIDLDLAIDTRREEASGVQRRTGTRAFMEIRVLEGQGHAFMHDLESFSSGSYLDMHSLQGARREGGEALWAIR